MYIAQRFVIRRLIKFLNEQELRWNDIFSQLPIEIPRKRTYYTVGACSELNLRHLAPKLRNLALDNERVK